jgi:hypothetical protein
MILTSDELPKTDGLVSDAVIFLVDGIRYAGHYHSNGWFYCDEWRKGKVGMAKGPHATASTFDSGRLPDHKATAWEYVRSNVKVTGAPPTDANKGEEN